MFPKCFEVTKNPVICICNDRSDQQVRQLASHCLDLRFRRPENSSVAKRVKKIMESEGKKVRMRMFSSPLGWCDKLSIDDDSIIIYNIIYIHT